MQNTTLFGPVILTGFYTTPFITLTLQKGRVKEKVKLYIYILKI